MKTPRWALIGSVYAFLGVALGAFGAHALSASLSETMQAVYHTATLYLFVHALGLIGWDLYSRDRELTGFAAFCGWSFSLGILLFSGSLYLLAISGIKGFGAITPLGGILFLVGWASFARSALQARPQQPK